MRGLVILLTTLLLCSCSFIKGVATYVGASQGPTIFQAMLNRPGSKYIVTCDKLTTPHEMDTEEDAIRQYMHLTRLGYYCLIVHPDTIQAWDHPQRPEEEHE